MKDSYVFPAVLTIEDDGISVEYPDLPGCFTCGDNEAEAIFMAKDALMLHLYGMEEDADEIPEPCSVTSLTLERNQVPVLVDVWMPAYRDKIASRSVNKTLTLPKWLNDLADQKKVNFSHVLQTALKHYLGVENYEQIRRQP